MRGNDSRRLSQSILSESSNSSSNSNDSSEEEDMEIRRSGQLEEDDSAAAEDELSVHTETIDERIIVRFIGGSQTVHSAREELLLYITNSSDNLKVPLFVLDDNITPSPRPVDPANKWTDDLVVTHRGALNHAHEGRLKNNVSIMTNKISRYRRQEMTPVVFCVVCWQKYF